MKELRIKSSDFEVKATIGRGHFGEVQVVHEKTTDTVYAMKVLRKSDLLAQPDVSEWMGGGVTWFKLVWIINCAFNDAYQFADYFRALQEKTAQNERHLCSVY